MRRFATFALSSFLVLLAYSTAVRAESGAAQMVRATTDEVLAKLRQEGDVLKTDHARLYALVDEMILPHFDFTKMSQRVLGKHWRDATPEQRARFTQEFKTLLVRTYSTALVEYRDQTIEFLPTRENSPSEVSVRTQVVKTSGGPPIPITYEAYNANGEWKVYDVSINGVSLVINYRASFSTEINKSGIDGLIAQLVQHSADKQNE